MPLNMTRLPSNVVTDAEPTYLVSEDKSEMGDKLSKSKQRPNRAQTDCHQEMGPLSGEDSKEEAVDEVKSIEEMTSLLQKKIQQGDEDPQGCVVPKGWSSRGGKQPEKSPQKGASCIPSDGEADSVEDMSSLQKRAEEKAALIEGEVCGTGKTFDCRPPTCGNSQKSKISKPPKTPKSTEKDSESGRSNSTQRGAESRRPPRVTYPVSSTDSELELTDDDRADMPAVLRLKQADIFLITSRDDEYSGQRLKDLIETVEFRKFPQKAGNTEKTKCRVYLLTDIHEETSQISSIKEAQEKCTYVFIYLTKAFCHDRMADFQKDDALVRSIISERQSWGIVPLYTQPKHGGPPEMAYEMPNGLISFRGLDMSRLMKGKKSVEDLQSLTDGDTYFSRSLVSMLEAGIHKRLKREGKQNEQIAEWERNKIQELKKLRIIKENEKRLKMEREEQEFQEVIDSLPKELPSRPPKPVDVPSQVSDKPEPQYVMRETQPPAGASPYQPTNPFPQMQPQYPNPWAHPPSLPLSPDQHQRMMMFWQQMHQQPQAAPSYLSYPPNYYPPNYYPNPHQQFVYPFAHPPTPQIPPTRPPTAENLVNNYYISGTNVQVGSGSSIVTQEPQIGGAEDEADILARRYNPEPPLSDIHSEKEYPEVPTEKVQKEHPPPTYSSVTEAHTKGRRSPEETTSPEYPDELQRGNLVYDHPPSSTSSTGKFYSSEHQESACSQDSGKSDLRSNLAGSNQRVPTEMTDEPVEDAQLVKTLLGVQLRSKDSPEGSLNEQTLSKEYMPTRHGLPDRRHQKSEEDQKTATREDSKQVNDDLSYMKSSKLYSSGQKEVSQGQRHHTKYGHDDHGKVAKETTDEPTKDAENLKKILGVDLRRQESYEDQTLEKELSVDSKC